MNPEIYYDYVDSDPVVPIKITASNISNKYLAFLDTGSDGIAIPRELWEIFGDRHEVPAVMSDDPEILLFRENG